VRALGVMLAMLVLGPAAASAPGRAMFAVTLGNTDGTADGNICAAGITCTYIPSVAGIAPALVAPFSGTVTGFSVRSGSAGGTVALHVLRGGEGGTFLSVKTSPHIHLALGLNTFKILVPVQKGDVIGLDNDSSALIFAHASGDPLGVTSYFQPALQVGQTDQPGDVVIDQRLLLSTTIESTNPIISTFRQSASTWRESASVRRHVPVGTAFTFQVDQAVTGSLQFMRAGRGIGTLALTATPGRHTLRFTGQLSTGRTLKPGRYSVRLSVQNDAGDKAVPRALSFRVVG